MKKVVRQEVHWVPEDRKVELSGTERPFRVWTLYSLGGLPESKDRPPPELPITPVHNQGAFLEDHIHDWRMIGTTLSYYSRVAESNVWILVEYAV
jgi:hypothetical protein